MIRRLFDILTAISLLLCILALVSWLQSQGGSLRLVDLWPGYFRGATPPDEQSLRQLTLLAAALFTALPAARIASTARSMRRAEHSHLRILDNRCGSCGYDLRASTDRCPECGTMIPHPPAPDIAEDLLPCPRCGSEACKLVTVDLP